MLCGAVIPLRVIVTALVAASITVMLFWPSSATHTEPDRGAAAGAGFCCWLPEQPLSTARTTVAAPIVRSPTLDINDPLAYRVRSFRNVL